MKYLLLFLLLIVPIFLASAQDTSKILVLDSLRFKRSVFSGSIIQDQQKLRPQMVKLLFKEDSVSRRQYRMGRWLRPLGPMASIAGIGLGYVALKGTPASANISYENQDITVDYIVRDRTKLIGGLCLFLGGFLLVEGSNELISKSVKGFNKRLKTQGVVAQQASLHLGITPSGRLGLSIHF